MTLHLFLSLLLSIVPPYARSAFGGWLDTDHDCQDTRAELLVSRSLIPVTFTGSRHCFVATGLWLDEYTGAFERDASHLDVDHVVPLAEAWKSGAYMWTDAQRSSFANDTFELALTNSHDNRSKGDRTPDLWKPEAEPWHCMYLARWSAIKTQYDLSESNQEIATLKECQ